MADQQTSQALLDGLRAAAITFQSAIEATPAGRERSIAITNFEQAVMWAERAIAPMCLVSFADAPKYVVDSVEGSVIKAHREPKDHAVGTTADGQVVRAVQGSVIHANSRRTAD